MKILISLIFVVISFNSFSDDESGLGELVSKGDLAGDWMFVVGTKDSLILSKSGRFSISSTESGLRVTDLWKEQAVTFKEMVERSEQYPVTELLSKTKHKPLRLGSKDGGAKYSIFLKIGDPISINFFKSAKADLIAKGTDIFAVLGEDTKLFYGYSCADDNWKIEILSGFKEIPDLSSCNQPKMNRSASQVFALTNLLGIKRVPFAIVNSSDNGALVNYQVFKELK